MKNPKQPVQPTQGAEEERSAFDWSCLLRHDGEYDPKTRESIHEHNERVIQRAMHQAFEAGRQHGLDIAAAAPTAPPSGALAALLAAKCVLDKINSTQLSYEARKPLCEAYAQINPLLEVAESPARELSTTPAATQRCGEVQIDESVLAYARQCCEGEVRTIPDANAGQRFARELLRLAAHLRGTTCFA